MAFSNDDRYLLLHTSGIGPKVLQRLDEAGFDSMKVIHGLGVDHVIETMATLVPGGSWRNRRRALLRALATWSAASAQAAMRMHPAGSQT